VDRSPRLSHLRFAIHPPAQFLSSVLVNNFDLIFITVVVRHVLFSLATSRLKARLRSAFSFGDEPGTLERKERG
jgi:hypothetical protein